jgi:hypothetical protein
MAVDKDKGHFVPGAASSYPGHQTQEGITIAAVPYITAEQAASAFGKVNPYERGILPVLVIIENGSGKALRLDLTAQFVDAANHHLDSIPPEDVLTYQAIKKPPKIGPSNPLPIPLPKSKKKGPLNTPEIVNRALSVKLDSAGREGLRVLLFRGELCTGLEAVSERPERRLQRQGIFLLRRAARRQVGIYFRMRSSTLLNPCAAFLARSTDPSRIESATPAGSRPELSCGSYDFT